MDSIQNLRISGRIARVFTDSAITPLLVLSGLLLGLFAVLVTPREEEPQINVTFANIFIPFPGASPVEIEHLVSTPAEQVLSELSGVKHVYSISSPGMATLTVQFEVGEDRTDAIVRLYDKIYSNQDWLPQNLGVGQPLIKPRGIDDVPIVTLTLWTQDPQRGAFELLQIAHALEAELKRIPGTRDIRTIGGPERVVHVLLDPQKLAGFAVGLDDLRRALETASRSTNANAMVVDDREVLVKTGAFMTSADEVATLIIGMHDGKPVYLADVAAIRDGPDDPVSYVQFGAGAAALHKGIPQNVRSPAVTLSVAKKPGSNAATIANQVIRRIDDLRDVYIPEGTEITVTRNYGETADAKAWTLMKKLLLATLSVVALVLVTMGWREAMIVGIAVTVTLAMTLFASWAFGFTLNRVSLFALIFSIGILVDDAIVVVENIHRHGKRPGLDLLQRIPAAVDEVGGPTILATFTVIAALLPMAFVSGLMGPYMSPIPINASMGMLISLAVAFVVTPWLAYRLTPRHAPPPAGDDETGGRVSAIFQRGLSAILQSRGRQAGLLAAVALLIALSVSLVPLQGVVMKMLPFDDKSEFQVVVDMPEGASLEHTARVLDDITQVLDAIPEITDYQTYAGTAAPIGFNGLVRQYYLRQQPHTGQIQINLVDQGDRDRKSHDIALAVRAALAAEIQGNASIKVVEVPPGPPVLAPLVAEVYGLDYDRQIQWAARVKALFAATDDIVDVDSSVEAPGARVVISVDRQRAATLGVPQSVVTDTIQTLLGGEDVAYLHGAHVKYVVPIRLELPAAEKSDLDQLLALKVRSRSGQLVPLSEIVHIAHDRRQPAIHHKDLKPVVYVTADMAGHLDSPLYGMLELWSRLKDLPAPTGKPVPQYFVDPPQTAHVLGLKWDGEWQVTYDTFRDMGIAYAVGLILIYLLVVGQFKSYLVPLIIMAPIPMTVIGVLPGHALLGMKFTATSMIGMIALAGIIVRNSILLVDFANHEVANGVPFHRAVVNSAAVRAKPIMLTGVAAMLGAFFILDDPIFSGLAVSLIFGILVSTLLTLIVIPVMYYSVMRRRVDGAGKPNRDSPQAA